MSSSSWWLLTTMFLLSLVLFLQIFYFHFLVYLFHYIFKIVDSYFRCFLILMWNIWECQQFHLGKKDLMNFFMTHQIHCCTHIILLSCTSLQQFFFSIQVSLWLLELDSYLSYKTEKILFRIFWPLTQVWDQTWCTLMESSSILVTKWLSWLSFKDFVQDFVNKTI